MDVSEAGRRPPVPGLGSLSGQQAKQRKLLCGQETWACSEQGLRPWHHRLVRNIPEPPRGARLPQEADRLHCAVCCLGPWPLGEHGGASPPPSVTPSFLPSQVSFRQIWFPGADVSPEHSGASCLTPASTPRLQRETGRFALNRARHAAKGPRYGAALPEETEASCCLLPTQLPPTCWCRAQLPRRWPFTDHPAARPARPGPGRGQVRLRQRLEALGREAPAWRPLLPRPGPGPGAALAG